jgi:transposase
MKRKKRTFSREYKLAAVKKIVEQGLSYSEVARELSVSDGMLRNWRKAFESDGTLSKDAANNPSIEAEVKRLREENRQLMIERDILKKATAFFAKESR